MATRPGQSLVCALLTAVALGYTSGASEESPVIVTKYGMLEGRKVSVKGTAKPVYDYLGIPFAKPPIGALRFAAPQAAEAWTGIREATSQPPGCLQDEPVLEALKKLITFDFASNKSSEDCLYLNVHTPVAPKDKNKRLPVMVWIHGGGFMIGSASIYDGSPLAAYEDVVVVVIQYRLGILGFISTGDEHLPGNWGLLDQVAALKWVQENIENFGGDPGLVTIFGESAGGMSVSYHLVSPLSSGLFHRAISESGTALIKIGIHSDPKSTAKIIANATGCDTSDSQEIADCLKKLSEEELSNIVKPPEAILSVVVDGAFLHREVEQLVEGKEINSVPYLLGITNQECGWLLAKLLSPPGWEEGMDRETMESVLTNMSLINKDFLKTTIDEYLGDTQDKSRIRDLYLELLGDVIMLMPTIEFARFHRDAGNTVFLYEFQHRPSVYGNIRPDFVKSDHGDDIGFVFGAPFWNNDVKLLVNVTEEELALSRTVMSYWANFAKKGNPNGEGLVLWPLYDHDEGYMQLDLKQQAGSKLKEHRVQFHLELQKQEQKKRASEESPVVVTKYGMLEGRKVSVKGTAKPVYDYLGIPFAKPPIGALRFAAPQAAEAWTGIREATSQPPGCLQDEPVLEALKKLITFDFASNKSSEDCLYLNVHTPVAPKDKNKRLPVMVWIHGGGFMIGSASVYDGSPLAAYEDVVVVVIQYRLGILGFISTGDEHLPGNWGLLDQVAALKWVQENIENFGGDPGLVTIFGESAGGMSVSYHLVSPLSSGLFHRAISESGTALIKIGIHSDPKSTAKIIANATGCDTSDSQEIADCLKKLSEEELSNIVKPPEAILSVVVDGAFLHREVEQLVEGKEINSVPYLLGITNQECGWLLAKLLSPPGWEEGMDRETMESVLTNMSLINKDFLKTTIDEYLGDTQDKSRIRDLYLELLGDVIMLMPTIEFARFHRDAGNTVFLYEFQHRPSVYGNIRPDFVKSDHGDDIGFVFGAPFWNNDVKLLVNVTEEELALSRTVMSYWANFAKKGNPNEEGLVLWPLYDHDEGYMQLDLKQQAGSKLKEHRVQFHLELQKQERKKRASEESPVVVTKYGMLEGRKVSVKGTAKPVYDYLGIPFAKPPIGALRFAAPQAAEAWTGIREATSQPPGCLQDEPVLEALKKLITFGFASNKSSEDCLYLNVHTPVAPKDKNKRLPVMVWIHGGGFMIGSASVYDGSPLAAYEDVVVVVIQYRLGILGFISTGDEHLPGNWGLLDQVAALKWVQENIENFGGDPGLVTIFGESAGGMSVSYHLVSPLSSGLFHRAISESGTALIKIGIHSDPKSTAKIIANATGCDTSDSQEIADCLKKLSEEELSNIVKPPEAILSVVVDGAFLHREVEQLVEGKEINSVPYLLGITNQECGWLLAKLLSPPGWEEGMDRETMESVLTNMSLINKDFLKTTIDEYLGDTQDKSRIRDLYLELLGDVIMLMPTIEFARFHRDAGNTVFLYEFQHRPSVYGNIRPDFVKSDHGDDIGFVFGAPFWNNDVKLLVNVTEEELALSRTVMSYWANFAKKGNPNEEGLVLWPLYDHDEGYMQLDLKQQAGSKLKEHRVQFHLELQKQERKKRASEESPVVVTKYGMLEGRKVSVKGTAKPVYDYLGIPFAKPPIGALRFAAPQAAEAWTGIREATSQPPGCLQDEPVLEALKKLITFDFASNKSSEDCLYLNVHTPVAPKDKNKRLPVMVWIHGGGFMIGSASIYDGSPLAAYEDVVVVVIQYRLGILGFISTGDEHLPGNWGLLDQVAALKWVQENIENFGGDPGLVTIFGESAGGMSVSYHLVSPLSSGLFHRAISESGTALIKIGIHSDPKSTAKIIANATGCDTSDSQEIADCLKKLSEEELSNIVKPPEAILSVVVDGAFLHREVEQLVEGKEINSVPYLLGITNQECGWLLAKLLSPPGWEEGMDRETMESVLTNMSLINKDFLKTTIDEYLGDTQDKSRIRDLYLELLGDVIMLMPTIEFARFHRDAGNTVFLYEFQHRPSVYGNIRPDFVKSDHGDDIGFVFGAPFWNNDVKVLVNVTEEELALSRTVMSYWANFAKRGNPNGEGLVLWPLYDHDEGYMQLDLKQQAGSKLKEHRVQFHLELQKHERKKSEQNVKAAGHQRSEL